MLAILLLCTSNTTTSFDRVPAIFTEKKKNSAFALILGIKTQMEIKEINLKQSTVSRNENVPLGAYSLFRAYFFYF